MDRFSNFMNAIDAKNAYRDFMEKDGDDINDILSSYAKYLKEAFYAGWDKGKGSGESDGYLKAKLEVTVNMIKYTDLSDKVILGVLGKNESDAQWTGFINKTREDIKK